MLLGLYRVLTGLGAPAIVWWVGRRTRLGKEDAARRAERFGTASRPRPTKPLVWVHAASVGESLSALPLVQRIEQQGFAVLVTTGTVTSARIMGDRLPRGAVHQYAPIDRLAWVSRFLDHWKPDAAVWIESEIWPNTLSELKRRRIPAALVNARLSQRSWARWRRARGAARRLLSAFWVVLAQTEADRDRLKALGAGNAATVGNLKFSAEPLPADPIAYAALQGAVGRRPVWAMVSTHPGEEELAAEVHRRLEPVFPDLLTIVVPRHPQRGAEVEALFRDRRLPVARRSEGGLPTEGTAAYVCDTIGEMGTILRVAPVVCIGGSFVPRGGQNPIEPAQLGCAIVYGPSMFNFAEIAKELEEAGASQRVRSLDALAETVGRLIGVPNVRAFHAAAGRAVAQNHRQVADRVMAALTPVLDDAKLRAVSAA
jgi:3-deoxy-D-manno-octulosonic-acid transferase